MLYSFCPVCGGRLALPRQDGDSLGPDDLRTCGSCGHEFWLNSKPCVSALIMRAEGPRQYILLTRRGIEPYRGCWDVPGGYLRNGEPPETGLARELAEDLSAPLLQPRFAAIYLCTLPPEIELKPADDVTEARWFPLPEIPPDLAFASNRRALARLGSRIAEYLNAIGGCRKDRPDG